LIVTGAGGRGDHAAFLKTGKEVSGGPKLGHRPDWIEQRLVHAEKKLLKLLADVGIVKRGQILTIQGTLPACSSGPQTCVSWMVQFAREWGIKIIYTAPGEPPVILHWTLSHRRRAHDSG
jgi:hypothetical protein